MTCAVCFRCGRRRDEVADPVDLLVWVSERQDGQTRWLCHSCARSHARDIEGKLPDEYW